MWIPWWGWTPRNWIDGKAGRLNASGSRLLGRTFKALKTAGFYDSERAVPERMGEWARREESVYPKHGLRFWAAARYDRPVKVFWEDCVCFRYSRT